MAAWLTYRQALKDVIGQVRRRLHHAPGIARGADTPAFAGIGDEVVVATMIAARAGKAGTGFATAWASFEK